MFFYKNRWFNIIGQLKDYGIYFYCNIATPYVIDENVIKYIDYDLDLRVFPDGSFKVLDRGEYNYHKNKMNYYISDLHLGHENIIEQASQLFDEVVVAVLRNPKKPNGFFTIEERLELMRKIYKKREKHIKQI